MATDNRWKITRWWDREFFEIEREIPLAIAGAVLVLVYGFEMEATITKWLGADRSGLYQAIAAVAGSLLGFSITAVAIVIGFAQSPQLAVVRRSNNYELLWQVFQSGIRWLGLTTALAIMALVVDRKDEPHLLFAVVVFYSGMVAAGRVARTIWILERTIAILVANRGE